MGKDRFHFNANHLVNPCDSNPQTTADKAMQAHLCRSISKLPHAERDLIRRLVENLKLLAQSAPKRTPKRAAPVPQEQPVPLVSIGPSGLKGQFQAEF